MRPHAGEAHGPKNRLCRGGGVPPGLHRYGAAPTPRRQLPEIRIRRLSRPARAGRAERVSERGFAVLGLGYVGLPVALAFARHFSPVIGFDVSEERIAELKSGIDRTREVAADALRQRALPITGHAADLAAASFFIVAVPAPTDEPHPPGLRAL